MTRIPSDGVPESSLAFLADPYRFIGTRARQLGSDVFSTRLMGRRTICLTGSEAARLFYDTTRLQRAGAMPRRVVRTLLGEGGVQGLDGEAHRARKALLLELATGESLYRLHAFTASQWRIHLHRWQKDGGVCLYRGSAALLARAAFDWVGLRLDPDAAGERIRDMIALFDGAGAIGPRHWKALSARRRAERWLTEIIASVRSGLREVDPASPLARLARHRDPAGLLLPPEVAAVEVLNLVRPVAAISVYVTFAAHALHRHPQQRERLAGGDSVALGRFVEEVRRFYPFFPAVAARTSAAFSWRDFDFPAGRRVMLDLYGTNHDPRLWTDPQQFDPQRFAAPFDDQYGLIPQGGGRHAEGHRCAGEWVTRALLRQATALLVSEVSWEVEGDPPVDFARLPALPVGGMMLRNIRARR